MSVLSRPVRHRAPAPSQGEVRIPSPRDGSSAESVPRTGHAGRAPTPRSSAPAGHRHVPRALLAAGAVAVLAVAGGTTYLITDDDGGAATVIAPAYVPTDTDLARDTAAGNRDPGRASLDDTRRVTEAQRDAALEQRARNAQP